jgi:hypothetical protein
MPLDVQFHMRLSVEQVERIRRVATGKDFKLSTWVRSAVMKEVRRLEAIEARKSDSRQPHQTPPEIRRVAEPSPRSSKNRP